MATVEQDKAAPKDATLTPDELFRYSAWVHAGTDAETCEQRETGRCEDATHFHAWCRLPNQLQHDDIRERALAAKARRIRQLRDPETDAYAILDSDLTELGRTAATEDLIAEIVAQDWWKRQLDAMRDTEEEEEFKTVERDQERLQELRALDPDDRPSDEYDELQRHLERYNTAVAARVTEIEAPVAAATAELSRAELLDVIRNERITAEANKAFMDTYSRWEWMAGTYTSADPVARRRVWSDVAELQEAAPETLQHVRDVFAELEGSLQRGMKGN